MTASILKSHKVGLHIYKRWDHAHNKGLHTEKKVGRHTLTVLAYTPWNIANAHKAGLHFTKWVLHTYMKWAYASKAGLHTHKESTDPACVNILTKLLLSVATSCSMSIALVISSEDPDSELSTSSHSSSVAMETTSINSS